MSGRTGKNGVKWVKKMHDDISLIKPMTTHEVPPKISTGIMGLEHLTTMQKMLHSRVKSNAQSASLCVTLAILEAVEKGKLISPKEEYQTTTDNKFNWGEGDTSVSAHSISFAINELLKEEIIGEDNDARRKSFTKLVQKTLIPRGMEIIEEKTYEELCDWFIEILTAND